jgi:hypothetical protein
MKYLFLFTALTITIHANAQIKTNVLIISSKEGKLLVDGNERSWLNPNETTKLTLDEGDHIIQVKTANEMSTQTITCNDGKQKVVNFDFSSGSNIQPTANSETDALTVADIQLNLPSSLSNAPFLRKFYAFDEGDAVTFDFDILNKNGTINIYFYSYPDNALIYSKEKTNAVSKELIKIPKRGVYYFSFSTNHIINRSAHFVVKRQSGPSVNKNFKTAVRIKYDTTYQEVLNSQVRVYSTGNFGHTNRTTVRINLPARTTYWVYWIGVGQESMDRMKSFADKLSRGASGLATDPISALGFRLISSLPMFNSTATVDYRFADNPNSEMFSSGAGNYQYYNFKEGKNITTDYSIERTVSKEMNLCLWNNNPLLGHDVSVKVGAFLVTASYVPESGL